MHEKQIKKMCTTRLKGDIIYLMVNMVSAYSIAVSAGGQKHGTRK